MKYLAILKDSLREAIDTKVFYAMLALSLVLILFVASIGFRPVEAEDAFPAMVHDDQFRFIRADRGQSTSMLAKKYWRADFAVTNVKALTEATAPNARDYAFTLTITELWPFALQEAVDFWSKPTPDDFRQGVDMFGGGKSKELHLPNRMLEEFVQQHFSAAADLTVEKVSLTVLQEPTSGPDGQRSGKYQFDLQTKGRTGTKGWPHDVSLFFGLLDPQQGPFRATVGGWVFLLEGTLINSVGGWVALMVGIVITAFFIPNMLRKGTIDMLLSKPIHRPRLLAYKYTGGLAFVFLNSLVAIGGVWLVIGLRSGIWAPGFFLTIFTLTFFFAILYSVSTLFSVLTRSPIVSILTTVFVWFVLFAVGQAYGGLVFVRKEPALQKVKEDIPSWVFTTADVVHFILPRTSDLSVLNAHLVGSVLTDNESREKGFYALPDVSWPESITVSLAFIAVMLGLACWRFSAKDY